MAQFQLSVLFSLGLFITLINGQCVVNFQNGTVSNTGATCVSFSNASLNNILTCSGIQLSDLSQGNLKNLKEFTDSTFDLYMLLRSRLDASLVVSAINNARSNGSIMGSLSDATFARLWSQVKLSPFLSSLSRETLSCLSQNSNLNCQSFQALVQDLSLQIGPERQNMVYQNFIKPFLARNTTDAGCVKSANSNEQWLSLNFQTFSTSGTLEEFKALKSDFNGLAVLDKLSSEQKAQLIFQLEASESLNIDAINQILQTFLQPLTDITLNLTRTTSLGSDQSLADFQVNLRPLGRFIRTCVALSQATPTASARNLTINLLMNWTMTYDNQILINTFNISSVSEWFNNVVKTVMMKHLQAGQTLPDTTDISNFVFAPEPQIPEPVEICKVTSNNGSCLISQTGESLGKAINCVAQSNLSFTEENLRLLTTELSKPLQIQATNPSQSNLTVLYAELPAESFTSGNLDDVEFMRSWFQIKMKPLLSKIPREFLSCLRTRNFTCQAYKALFVELSNSFGLMDITTQRLILTDFIVPFLTQRQSSGVDCTLPFKNSSDFILQNFGSFSQLAQLQLISKFNSNFSAVEALPVLTLEQLNELVFSPPASPADRTNILTKVFDFLLQDQNREKLNNFPPTLQAQARKANFSCGDYKLFFDKIDQKLSVNPNLSEALLTIRDSTMMIPPDECIERASQCTTTPVNESSLCASVNSSALDQLLKGASPNATIPLCNFTILQFACLPTLSQLNSQRLADVLACKQPNNVGKDAWKLFFTKTSTNLDDALLKFSNMTLGPSNVSLSDVLEVLVDVRVDRFSPQRLRDPAFIRSWFQERLRPFFPSVSQRALSCLSTKPLTCETYRIIFVELSNSFGLMDITTQRLILTDFIVPFLTQRQSAGVDCTLPFKNSSDFILQIFGSFSQLAQLQLISKLNSNFSAVEALPVLTLEQLNELVFSPPASPADRTNILTKVFDFLLQDQNREKLNNFPPTLQAQARKANFSCGDYKLFFDKIDQKLSVSPNLSEALLTIRDSTMMIPPDECVERASQCTTTPVNESSLCASVNSSALDQLLKGASPNATIPLCNFTILQFACLPTLSQLNSQRLADVLACKQPSNVGKDAWKLFFTKTSTNLDDALLKFSNMTLGASNVSLSDVLEVLVDVRVDRFSPQRLRDPAFIRSWFQERLRPFFPSVSQRALSCLSTKPLTCETYRIIIEAFVNAPLRDGQDVCRPLQPTQRQDLVYTEFMKAFLSRNDSNDPRCLGNTTNSAQWINRNFGPFVQSANLTDLLKLNSNFTAVEVLPLLSLKQLVEFSTTPGGLTDPQRVINVMQLVKDCQFTAFFDLLGPKVQDLLTPDVKAALIKQIFDRANLSSLNITDRDVQIWIQDRLSPLLANLSESLVSPFFTILSTRDCNITQSLLRLLGGVRSSLPANTKNAIYNSLLQSFAGPQPLRCYRNNSFITFLNESLFGFGSLPNLTTFLSLMPQPRKSELINSMSPSELGSYLRQPEVVNNDSQVCVLFNNFVRTPEFLETEVVPDNVKSTILPCVWPLALKSDNQTEIDLWFNQRLRLYLKFLNKDILGSKDTLNASCLSYRKMVNVLGNNFTFNGSQISNADVYTTIKTYLKAGTAAKCYDISDARLNSTAWFVNHIGVFITFLSLDDLYSFGPENTMRQFAVNPENIKLFNQLTLPKNVTSRFTELIFLQNINFNLFDLPSVLQCDAPVSVFKNLNENQTNIILANFKSSCSNVDPAISTALSRNIKTIDDNAIRTLGDGVVGLTPTQINSVSPKVIENGLSTLSNASGWSFGQAKIIINVLLSGTYKFTDSSSLVNVGSLIGGIPSTILTTIDPQQILATSKSTAFVKNILSAPEIVQKTFVTQIIKLSSEPAELVKNVPDEMASQIPRNLLSNPTTLSGEVLTQFNNKKWKPEQAVLFFDNVASAFPEPDDLSVEVLQGFTCSRVRTFTQEKVRGLIKACRRRQKRPKVVLSETQLTCMYNLVRKESTLDFTIYHPDMLLYYNYDTINKTFCKAYFAEVGAADLSIFSSTLSGRRDILWRNAVDCFGINGTSIQKQDLAVLGNLACAANSNFITNSDPEIIENLKNCNDLSVEQIAAMESVLLKGTSKYGPTSSWNQKTLDDLGILPLYFSQNFWGVFKQSDSNKFLKTFLPFLRGKNTPKPQMKNLFRVVILTSTRSKRSAACDKDSIDSVIISDPSFPIGYTASQFSNCLNASVVIDNLASLCEKIDDSTFQRVILDKLNEISPNGLSEDQVQVLKSVSRNATVDEISKWNITKIDTLAALMNANDGEWSSAQSNQIITKYLSAKNNLTATELNIVKGPNLCSLTANTLSTILPESIRAADALTVTKCSSDNKKALFTVANKAFPLASGNQSNPLSNFQLIEPYLGGADLTYIRSLISNNVSMSLSTFISLDPSVSSSLNVSEVVGLLGNNLQDLKTYENDTNVRSWISQQFQSVLDKLNLELSGGKADTTTAVPTTVTTATTATTVKNSGAPGFGRSGWSVSLSILVFIFTIIKVEII